MLRQLTKGTLPVAPDVTQFQQEGARMKILSPLLLAPPHRHEFRRLTPLPLALGERPLEELRAYWRAAICLV